MSKEDTAIEWLIALPIVFVLSFCCNLIATGFGLIFWNGWLAKATTVPSITFWQLFGGLTLLSAIAGYLKVAMKTAGKH